MDPVGILKACTTKVVAKRAMMAVMTMDSKYSRVVDFLNSNSHPPGERFRRPDDKD